MVTPGFDLKGILQLLYVNNDVDVQLKFFSSLSAYLMTNDVLDIDVIITNNYLYDKICNILSKCHPRKATILFNFLSAILYAVDEDNRRTKNLIIHAKNMLRSSGCLATMCELFSSCMMHQDAWRSLCRCLAEICRSVEANQSYCTHLVPSCVQRCSQMNIEIFMILESLLQNHAKNTKLFLECNGLSLFQRDLLQNDVCLQLLSTLAQNSSEVVQTINETNIQQDLRDFLHLYGAQSQLGQWATIILYHLTGTKGIYEINSNKLQVDNDNTNKEPNKSVVGNVDLQCSTDTTRFFHSVMREIVQTSPPSDLKYLQHLFPTEQNIQRNKTYTQGILLQNKLQTSKMYLTKNNVTSSYYRPSYNIQQQNEGREMKLNNLSFSFLQQLNINNRHETENYEPTETLQRSIPTNTFNSRQVSDINCSYIKNSLRHGTPDTNNFKPQFSSTPKRYSIESSHLGHSSYIIRKSRRQQIKKYKLKSNIEKKQIRKFLDESKMGKDNKHRSWFQTINESCSTLVKTVKNIFRPKTNIEETKATTSNSIAENKSQNCSYNFTNYMRKRDAILKNGCVKKLNFSCHNVTKAFSNNCSTCNDTIALKHKLDKDEYLKQTIRKLKLGINLYGCDFKKISKQLWPQESYMTPSVLYNLYRKLIIK